MVTKVQNKLEQVMELVGLPLVQTPTHRQDLLTQECTNLYAYTQVFVLHGLGFKGELPVFLGCAVDTFASEVSTIGLRGEVSPLKCAHVRRCYDRR